MVRADVRWRTANPAKCRYEARQFEPQTRQRAVALQLRLRGAAFPVLAVGAARTASAALAPSASLDNVGRADAVTTIASVTARTADPHAVATGTTVATITADAITAVTPVAAVADRAAITAGPAGPASPEVP